MILVRGIDLLFHKHPTSQEIEDFSDHPNIRWMTVALDKITAYCRTNGRTLRHQTPLYVWRPPPLREEAAPEPQAKAETESETEPAPESETEPAPESETEPAPVTSHPQSRYQRNPYNEFV